MKISRRDVLKLVGGSAAGFIFTPAPWKVLDDTAIWTQNWPWMQKPLNARLKTTFTTCPLCPAGCAVKARCNAGQPVFLSGVAGHPQSGGSLCPMGLSAHHLPFHPARVSGPMKRATPDHSSGLVPAGVDEIVGTLAGIIGGASALSVAVLDRQPGRCISRTYRRFLGQLPHGIYLTTGAREQNVFSAYRSMCQPGALGLDIGNSRTILSFGAPLLDGWGSSGLIMQLLKRGLHLIQAETRQSRTANLASTWLPIKPGSEVPLALGLAHVLVNENLYDQRVARSASDASGYFALVKRFTPETVAELTGLPAEAIKTTARQLARQGPAIAVGGGEPGAGPLGRDEELAIAGLNFLLGSVGVRGGFVAREETPGDGKDGAMAAMGELESVPDGSIRLLIMDGAESGYGFPWHIIERKLEPGNAVVVSLSPYHSAMARHADYIIPAPAAYESPADLPVSIVSPAATFSISAPLFQAPPSALGPEEVIGRLAVASGIAGFTSAPAIDDMKRKAEAIFRAGRGTVFTYADGRTVELRSVSSSDQFWKLLFDGGCWCDEPGKGSAPRRFSFFGGSDTNRLSLARALENRAHPRGESPLVLMPFAEGESESGQVSPIMTKLYRESGLRASPRRATISPTTAMEVGCRNGEHATLQTRRGSMEVEIREDRGVMPGVVHVSVGPDSAAFDPAAEGVGEGVLAVCEEDGDSTWRMTPAKLRGGRVS